MGDVDSKFLDKRFRPFIFDYSQFSKISVMKRNLQFYQKVRKIISLISLTAIPMFTFSQELLTLDSCYQLARENYPLIKKHALIDKSKDFSIENIGTGDLPQIRLGGQATYQSAVTEIPINLPGNPIQPLSKDQYKVYAEVEQNIYNGGRTAAEKEAREAEAVTQHQSLEVQLYQLKNRINELYFGTLLAQQNLKQNALHQQDISSALGQTTAMIAAGTALRSNAAVLKAALLALQQRAITLQANRIAYCTLLGMFIHRPLDTTTQLIWPDAPPNALDNKRPELALFQAQKARLDVSRKLTNLGNQPRLDLFMQGGYGRPGLNMLSNQFDPYYIGGIRISWDLHSLYTARKQRSIIDINEKEVDLEKQAFVFNTALTSSQESTEIQHYRDLLTSDDQIIALRTEVKKTALAQLKEGVLTIHDYLLEVNEAHQAEEGKILHQIQLLNLLYRQKTTMGQ